MSLRITPATTHPSSKTNTTQSAPSAPGLPDILRASHAQNHPNPTSTNTSSTIATPSVALSSTHPLESRLLNWTATQDALKLESLRRTFGIAEPVRRGMELKIVREGSLPGGLGAGPSVHEDILTGRDAEVSWEDVYTDEARVRGGEGGGVAVEMGTRN